MKKPYSVKFTGIDGTSTHRFSDLAAVVRYVRPRDLGSDYRRFGYLQSEFGHYDFEGFGWPDLLDGPAGREESAYKAELVATPPSLYWRETTCVGMWPDTDGRKHWSAKDSNELVGGVNWYPDKPCEYFPHIGLCCVEYLFPALTLEAAKAAVLAAYAERWIKGE